MVESLIVMPLSGMMRVWFVGVYDRSRRGTSNVRANA
jgi:hypothetical protein